MTLTRRNQSLVERSREIAELSLEERRRFAAEAARDRDIERLWRITEAYLGLHGTSGARVSPHTLRSYRRGLEVLLEAWSGVNLLRPEPDDGVLFVRMLEAQRLDEDLSETHYGSEGEEGNKEKEGKARASNPGYALATIRNRLAAARTFYKALRWMGATEANPFENVKVARDLTESWDQQAAYSEHEVKLMASRAKDQEDVVILYLGSHGGLRVSEMLMLEWRDIRFDVGELLIRKGKGGKSAWVSLSPTLQLELRRLPRVQERILSVTSWYGVYYRVRQMALKAGVPFLGVHALRHTAGTKLYEQTESLGVVADHLRHANVETARRYAKARSKRVKKALESW